MLEACCVAIVLTFVVVRARRDAQPLVFLRRLLIMSSAGWVAENTVIEAYGFYAYSPRWSVILHHVPLMIIVIWPMVIHSAWDLARHLWGRGHSRAPWFAAALVLADAWLIEPVAVNAGLWHWTHPGLFEVPPIGVIGWAIFAWFVVWLFERSERAPQVQSRLRWDLSALLLPAIGTHLVLLLLWWTALRWVDRPIPPFAGVAVAWGVSLTLAGWALVTKARARVPLADLSLRVPGALFFFVLLGLHYNGNDALVAYALAFAPPYLALISTKSRVRA